ncbi:MAG: class I SAM-dependent methyltransferase [Deltaproteobacteria bacterium]|nr:class I SAM-dependent methyltransferase [Deltaproteobacteria bacterium]
MAACKQCRYLQDQACAAHPLARSSLGRPLAPPPLGACFIPIVEGYLEYLRPGMRVLEVGCGSWERLRRHCQELGAHYEGIDTAAASFGRPTIATRLENLANLTFPDDSFDLVVGSQSMEHWPEYGCSLSWGLYQCFRVVKPGGRVLLNVPIHFHGARPFFLGERESIRQLLEPFSGQIVLEAWGHPSAPLPPLYPHPGYWRLRHRPAFHLDIQAVKDRALPRVIRRRGLNHQFLAKLLMYPPSYVMYVALRKMGFFPKLEIAE